MHTKEGMDKHLLLALKQVTKIIQNISTLNFDSFNNGDQLLFMSCLMPMDFQASRNSEFEH
jgi:hypothetical protein